MNFGTTLAILSVFAVIATAEIQVKSNYDLVLNLLPLYGGTKLSKVLTPRALSKTVGFFKKNPHHYETLRTELATEGVFAPELNNLKLEVITSDDFKTINNLVGSTTLRQAFDIEYAESLYKKISNDEELVNLLKTRLQQGGITFNEDVDTRSVIKTLIDAFEPIVPSFISTGINIIIFGK